MPKWSARALERMGVTQEEYDAKHAKADEPKRSKANLIAEAEGRGLDASGTVAELIARLDEADKLYGPGVPKPGTDDAK